MWLLALADSDFFLYCFCSLLFCWLFAFETGLYCINTNWTVCVDLMQSNWKQYEGISFHSSARSYMNVKRFRVWCSFDDCVSVFDDSVNSHIRRIWIIFYSTRICLIFFFVCFIYLQSHLFIFAQRDSAWSLRIQNKIKQKALNYFNGEYFFFLFIFSASNLHLFVLFKIPSHSAILWYIKWVCSINWYRCHIVVYTKSHKCKNKTKTNWNKHCLNDGIEWLSRIFFVFFLCIQKRRTLNDCMI